MLCAVRVFDPSRTVALAQARSVQVAAGGNLQAALDSAVAGDIIELQAGATFTGNFVLAQKSGTGYITIRTQASEGLPKAGDPFGDCSRASLPACSGPMRSPAFGRPSDAWVRIVM